MPTPAPATRAPTARPWPRAGPSTGAGMPGPAASRMAPTPTPMGPTPAPSSPAFSASTPPPGQPADRNSASAGQGSADVTDRLAIGSYSRRTTLAPAPSGDPD